MSQYLSQTRIEEPTWFEADDILFLRNRISEAETQLESLDGQIDQRDAKLVDIAACQNVLSPIGRVPLEILGEIFCLSCSPDYIWRASHNIIHYTSILSCVCVAWRKAANATPQLWSTLCLNAENNRTLHGQFGWLEKWVDRCQGHSLDLYLALPEGKSRNGEELFHSILRFSHKIRVLNVSGYWSSLLPLIYYSSFPLLEEVDFEVNDIPNADGTVKLPPHKIDALLGAPKLRRATMREFGELSLLTVLILPVEQLTSLRITSDFNPSNIYMNLLHRCKNLVNLELHYDSDFILMDNARSSLNLHICLPSLKSLSLHGNLLECFTAPHLEELTLLYDSCNFHSFYMKVDAFQQRSRTALSTLSFENFNDHGEEDESTNFIDDLIAMLSLFPTLSKYGISDCSFNVNPLLRALTVNQSGQVLLPKLEHLSLLMYDCKNYSLELKALILSRWWPDDDIYGCVSEDGHGSLRLQTVALNRRYFKVFKDITPALPGLIILDSWN
ncbi:hypothetical protein BT96DRAFT_913896 [Gymnopus androsaceus JB14]|uniref:Uncharacterized protein n=1 Tax=Gymnopus androsaceus JB14 TaxID=1447944 RepID=A0A6A4IFL0_9AGAR|nr:hypothetical protein BT96DRAFT_913896 [Gymnopus androsaceus JB14]